MNFKIVTPVTEEGVSLTEARLQAKVDSDDESQDTALTGLITASREYAEHYTGRGLAPVTLEAALDEFPACGGAIVLPMPPVSSIVSVKYTDTAGVEQTLAPSSYALDTYDERSVSLTYGNSWPSTQDVPNAVRVQFVTGYAADDLPRAIKSAMLIHIEMDSPVNPTDDRKTMEKARDALLDTKKVYG